jgi:hypothetical protein
MCDSDVTGTAPMSELLAEIDSTDWQVIQNPNPAVTTKFICPGCQALRRDSGELRLPDVTPERSSPFERMKAAGETLQVSRLQTMARAKPHDAEMIVPIPQRGKLDCAICTVAMVMGFGVPDSSI